MQRWRDVRDTVVWANIPVWWLQFTIWGHSQKFLKVIKTGSPQPSKWGNHGSERYAKIKKTSMQWRRDCSSKLRTPDPRIFPMHCATHLSKTKYPGTKRFWQRPFLSNRSHPQRPACSSLVTAGVPLLHSLHSLKWLGWNENNLEDLQFPGILLKKKKKKSKASSSKLWQSSVLTSFCP